MPISKIKAGGINDDAVTTAKIVDGTVAAVDIADGAVTSAKLDTNIDIDGTLDVTSTLTADGNVFVGHTSQYSPIQNGGSGVTLNTNGQVFAGGQFPSYFNREDSDGDVLVFRKDGTQVGSIGTRDTGALEIGSDDVYLQFNGNNDWIKPVDGSGNNKSGVDLGTSGARFDNLYLSGGIYLGGTTSVNYLDDYEEGTWTPAYTFSSSQATITYLAQVGHYAKVGNLVTFSFTLQTSAFSGGSGYMWVSGLPFTAASPGGHAGGGFLNYARSWAADHNFGKFSVGDSATVVSIYVNANNTSTPAYLGPSDFSSGSNSNYLQITGLYRAS